MKKPVKIAIAASAACLIAIVGSVIWLRAKKDDDHITKKQWMEKLYRSYLYGDDRRNKTGYLYAEHGKIGI